MKIVHLSVSDKVGAFEATRRLHKSFQAQGHESVIVVREKLSTIFSIRMNQFHLVVQKESFRFCHIRRMSLSSIGFHDLLIQK